MYDSDDDYQGHPHIQQFNALYHAILNTLIEDGVSYADAEAAARRGANAVQDDLCRFTEPQPAMVGPEEEEIEF